MTVLTAREAYRLWAPTYEGETAISFLENEIVEMLTPPLKGKRLLDAGCGVGRRLTQTDATLAVGIDLSGEMLSAGGVRAAAVADLRAMPFATAAFDVIWCRLVIGHLAAPDAAYRELARACRPGGHVVVTDFHPEAAEAGHRRSFRDATGVVRAVEHHLHPPESQVEMAAAAGLTFKRREDGRVGPSVRRFYDQAGRLATYRDQLGLGVVLALAFERDGG